MGILDWLRDCWVMMLRTKPQYISVLGRKRSSIFSPHKLPQDDEKSWVSSLRSFVCFVVMCCSISFGIVLLLLQDASGITASNLLIPLVVAGIASVSGGLCLSEYMSSQSQEVPSIYSCCYQYTSEILAFFIGWCWLLSQAATAAAICKLAAILVDNWTGNAIGKFFEKSIPFTDAESLPSVIFVLVLVFFVITGINENLVWYVLFVPTAFILILTTFALNRVDSKKEELFLYSGNWFNAQSVNQVMTSSSLCMLFFSGPQSLLRIFEKKVHQKTTAVLGPLNAISFVVILSLLCLSSQSGKIFDFSSSAPTFILTTNVLLLISLCILGIETFYSLHFVMEDMSTDGLLFRTFSKKWTPFCFPVASAGVQAMSVIATSLLVALLPLRLLLLFSVTFHLLVNSLVPFLVLNHRYRDNTAWQYEPMFHTTAKSLHDKSKKKVEESQYTNGTVLNHSSANVEMSTTCVDEETSSDDSSDTDIDSVVKQYKDQARIANMSIMEEHDPSSQMPEPTPSSSFRAKLGITALFVAAIINSIALNFADMDVHFLFVVVSLLCVLFSTIIQSLLLFLPQNGNHSVLCCKRMPRMPWIPGVAALINTCLFVHCLVVIWKVYLGWIALGALCYFGYGIRSSTAANSFHNLRPAHINLTPLPSYGNKCIPQVVPSQIKKQKSRHHTNTKRKTLLT